MQPSTVEALPTQQSYRRWRASQSGHRLAVMSAASLLQAAAVAAGIELSIVAVLSAASLALVAWVSHRASTTRHAWIRTASRLATTRIRRTLIGVCLFAAALPLAYNGWLASRGVDARSHTQDLLRSIAADDGRAVGILLAEAMLLTAA